jgi:hypothetical protein
MSKTRNRIKDVTLAALVIAPIMIGSAFFTATTAFAQDKSFQPLVSTKINNLSLEDAKQKILKGLDKSIERLQKVRSRVEGSDNKNKDEILSKIDDLVSYLKSIELKDKIKNASTLQDLETAGKDLRSKIEQNDVSLGKIFDAKKAANQEKLFNKTEKLLDKKLEKSKTLSADKVKQIESLVQKARNLMNQLKNEDKKNKDKVEMKNEKREFVKTLDEIRKLVK